MTKIKATFLEGDTKYHISRPGGGPACNADAYFPYSNKKELPRKSVCKNCLRSSRAEYEEIPKHIAEMPNGYRIMKVGEVITHETMYWAWDAGPWTPYGDNKEPWFQVGDVLRCDEDCQPFPHCCPVDLQETPETSDNADSCEPVSDKERISDLEKQVEELNAANDELNEDDAKQVQLICKLERKVAQLIAIDKRVTDYIDDLCREHETEVNELKRKLDASSEASTHERTAVNLLTEKLEKADNERDKLLREFKVMRDKFNAASQVIDINMELTAEHGERWKAELLEYRAATKGHTIENITTMMDTMPPADDLDGYTLFLKPLRKGDDYWNEVDLRWLVQSRDVEANIAVVAWVRTPIIEYIPTYDICDAMCEELGRIPAEFSDTGEYSVDPEERCRGQLVLVVQDPVGFRYISDRGARAWKYCRIRKDTIERLRAEK